MNKYFPIEVIDVFFLEEDENNNSTGVNKETYPVLKDENGKYIEIYFSDIGKKKHYLSETELQQTQNIQK